MNLIHYQYSKLQKTKYTSPGLGLTQQQSRELLHSKLERLIFQQRTNQLQEWRNTGQSGNQWQLKAVQYTTNSPKLC